MYKYNKYVLFGTIIWIGLLCACGGLSSKQKTEAEESLKALQKISAATEVGVNYEQYGLLVIEAKAKSNEAMGVLPEGELKQELNAAMDAYADAGSIWGDKIKSGYSSSSLFTNSGIGQLLIPKYNLPTVGGSLKADDAQQLVWSAARRHLEKAASLLK